MRKRSRQESFLFDSNRKSERLWRLIPVAAQTEIARLYARLLLKGGKIAMSTHEGESHDEQ